MSEIRKVHRGYFHVTLGLSLLWYFGLGICFMALDEATERSETYQLVTAYVPMIAWGATYICLGTALLLSISFIHVPHMYVRICCLTGLCLTTSWLGFFLVALMTGRLDLPSVLPAWLFVAVVEWAAFREPIAGPGTSL